MSPIETLKKSEARKKKIAFLVVGAVVMLYCGRGALFHGPIPVSDQRQFHPPLNYKNPDQVKAEARAAAAGTIAPSTGASLVPPGKLNGFWAGTEILNANDRGLCTMHLEVRFNDNPADGAYKGFSSLACVPTNITGNGKPSAAMQSIARAGGLNPAAAVLLGSAKDDAIEFHVKRTVGATNCPISSASIAPFGVAGASFNWKEDGPGCSGGQMLLEHTER